MLYRAPVRELTRGSISRRYSYLVVVMQYYPRFVPKDHIDEYLRTLAPERGLFTEFKELDRSLKDHDLAFEQVRYEERFSIGPAGADDLRRLCETGASRDVFLLCQCLAPQRCHADLLLLLARHWFKAPTQTLRLKYPVFQARLDSGELRSGL